MWLAYFDENKFDLTADRPAFWIGGLLVHDQQAADLDRRLCKVQSDFLGSSVLSVHTELHGKELFHGKGNCKGRTLDERLAVFEQVADCVLAMKLPLRFIRIDVASHRAKYKTPEPEYRLGLMLALERYCDFLDERSDQGLVFCDYEADEITGSVLDFSSYKQLGSTKFWFGRSLDRIHDTIYFTHSHHSRFLQASDLMIYLAARYDGTAVSPAKWHEQRAWAVWEKIKANAEIQRWP